MTTLTATIQPTAQAPGRQALASNGAALRLTRRGRWAISLLALLIVAVSWMVTAGRSDAGNSEGAARTTQVVVQPGQTLWHVASRAMPGTDPREAVERVRALNALTTSVVLPGQALVVPVPA